MKDIYWGNTIVRQVNKPVSGSIVEIGGESYYRIGNYDRMPPFLMSVVSNSDHWMFVSSSGGLTCGRESPDQALFPYDTDDKIHDSAAHTGPRTCLLVETANRTSLWKPFSDDVAVYDIQRNLYKSLLGNRLVFEEINRDLDLVFTYGWSSSEGFGFVKTTSVRNTGDSDVGLKVLDGVRNLLPSGIGRDMQSQLSTLADAYKKSEKDAATGAGIYSLSTIPTDSTEPRESLKVTVAWCLGLKDPAVLLCEKQLETFCAGLPVTAETALNGQRGAYFVQTDFMLPKGGNADWYVLADIGLGATDLTSLLDRIARGISRDVIDADIEAGTRRLWGLVAGADGCQVTSDELVSGRHAANTLFNIMRGGTFCDEYRIRHDDFLDFVSTWNAGLRDQFSGLLAQQEDPLPRDTLLAAVESGGDAHLKRLALEYLPLCFSRRHGDPSRPWNKFNINIKAGDGSERLDYQGNWRDIFQNWEALAISYPEFIDSFIARFINASTVDGYNPYRIGRDGLDWEVPDPHDCWSNIGYWGDHQVNYLWRLLALSQRYQPGRIAKLLDQDIFVYADVPYRIRRYEALLGNPRDSIDFDYERARLVADRVDSIGADGKLVILSGGSICRVNLLEKLLVTVLCKLGNLAPGGGIWMYTQRPEWNDANNALVGYGLSMVTLSYLRRLLECMASAIGEADADSFAAAVEVVQFFGNVDGLLAKTAGSISETISDSGRKNFMDEMGAYASAYRERVYGGFSGEQAALKKEKLLTFLDTAMVHLDYSLGKSFRKDGLFHSYNLIHFGSSGYGIKRLPEMLEGQVAVLSSGFLQPTEGLALLDGLRDSNIYRPDQNSYMLYPDKELPSFLEKNLIPQSLIDASPLLQTELEAGFEGIIERDVQGHVHFHDTFSGAEDLRAVLQQRGNVSEADEAGWFELFEAVFKHREFTGRSSTMYKYEGIGCIYWHMVSKLLLAVTEFAEDARNAGAELSIIQRLTKHFEHIRNGLGLHKSPLEYGAIPLDPYSHTPGFAGVQQPGMTGQVKEDIITRFKELGVSVRKGTVSFEPYLLKRDEFISASRSWRFPTRNGEHHVMLDSDCLAFSLCGTAVIYRLAASACINVYMDAEQPEVIPGKDLGKAWSQSLFKREKRIRKILVDVSEDAFN